jgi:hypothetical protein
MRKQVQKQKQKQNQKTRKQTGRGLLFANGGSCTTGTCALPPQTGGSTNCRIGVLLPRFGGKRNKSTIKNKKLNTILNLAELEELALVGGDCGCGVRKPMMELPPGVKPSSELLQGGSCGCGNFPGSEYSNPWRDLTGGYRPTNKNKKYLKLWKEGKSIGFTMRSSLKAKGLIPRSNGTYKVSPKYQNHH